MTRTRRYRPRLADNATSNRLDHDTESATRHARACHCQAVRAASLDRRHAARALRDNVVQSRARPQRFPHAAVSCPCDDVTCRPAC